VEGLKVNLIDTPGEPSFIADALGALRECESAVFVVNAVMGVEVSKQRLWSRAASSAWRGSLREHARPRAGRLLPHARLAKAAFGPHVVATEIPIGSEHEVRGLIDLVDMKAYEYDGSGGKLQGVSRSPTIWRIWPGVPREADGRGRGELRRR
jgi:elongation factor G